MADSRQGKTGVQRAVILADFTQRLFHQRQLIGRVVDHEVPRQPDVGRLAPQQARAQRVERRNPHALTVHAQQGFDARAHFPRGLVGKRDGENAIRLHHLLADDVGDSVCDDAGFAGAGAGKDQQRTFCLENSFRLFGIEAGEKVQASILSASAKGSVGLYSTVTDLARLRG